MQIDIRTNAPAKVSAVQYADNAAVVPDYDTQSVTIADLAEDAEVCVEWEDIDNLVKALERAKELVLEGTDEPD